MKKSDILACFYMLLIFIGTLRVYYMQTAKTAVIPIEKKHIVLDAGHGGADPGKVARDGTREKEINLQIMQLLSGYLEQGGAVVTLTRNTDEALASGKNADLKARTKTARGADLFVSIHQNSYPSESVKGAQVFYLKGSREGERLAAAVQKRIKEVAAVDNRRSEKADNTYYILKNTNIPGVIVECGFLSNTTENNALKTEKYQKKIAWAIYMGIVDYFSEPTV